MLDKAMDFFLTDPKRIVSLGSMMATVGLWSGLAGLFGGLAITAINAMDRIGSQTAAAKTLAEIFSPLPTWWIPESMPGAVVALTLIISGMWVEHVGRRLLRFMVS